MMRDGLSWTSRSRLRRKESQRRQKLLDQKSQHFLKD
eukprot:UN01200